MTKSMQGIVSTNDKRAYGEGCRAKRAGIDTLACPYNPNSSAGISWFAAIARRKKRNGSRIPPIWPTKMRALQRADPDCNRKVCLPETVGGHGE